MNSSDLMEKVFNSMFQLRKLGTQKSSGTKLQFSALNFLHGQTDKTIGDLGQFLQLSKSSSTQLSERLVKLGFIKRFSDKKDRRVIHLVLTKIGEKELRILKSKILKKMGEIFAEISRTDLEKLIKINTKLVKALEKYEN